MELIITTARNLKDQSRALWKYLLLYFYLPVFAVLLAAFVFTKMVPSIKPADLFRDITALAGLPFYTGMVSQLGGLLWAASVTACFLALFLLRKLNAGSPQARQFLLHAGLFSAFLMFDDMFLFHEEIAPNYLFIGQKKIYLAYLLIALAFLYFNRKGILSGKYLLLGVAMANFGLSIVLDVAADALYGAAGAAGAFYDAYEVFFEDGLKFIGIATWLAFYLRYIYDAFVPVFERARIEPPL